MRTQRKRGELGLFVFAARKKELAQFVTKYLDFTQFSCKKIGFTRIKKAELRKGNVKIIFKSNI